MTSTSRCARRETSPTRYMRLESPCQPSTIKVTSILTMSPSRSGLSVGNAVADDMVDRGADRLAVAAIVERRRIGVVRHREIEDELVERLGGDARAAPARASMSSASAASRPALRMPSKASGPCSLIWPVLRPGTSKASTKVIESPPRNVHG